MQTTNMYCQFGNHQNFLGQRITSIKTIKKILRQFRETKSLKRKTRTVIEDQEQDSNILLYFEGKVYFTRNKKLESTITDTATYRKEMGKIHNTSTNIIFMPTYFDQYLQNLIDAHKILKHKMSINESEYFNTIVFFSTKLFLL